MKKIRLILLFSLAVLAVPELRAQALDVFWKNTRERLAKVPMDAKVEPVTEPIPYKKYRITLRSLDGIAFRAFLSLPIQGEAPSKPWPVIITAPGYGGWQQGVMLSECQRGYAVVQVFPRGQGESEPFSKGKGDKLTAQLDKPDGAYYQGACADVMRAIDFIESRKDLDHEQIALVGTSQGGGIALLVAAIDPRVKAVVAHVPFLCNFPLAAKTNSLVKTLLDRAHRNDEVALHTLKYFDPFELAPQLRVPILMSAGGKDELCPLATVQSVYERIPGSNKTLKIYPDLSHTSCVDFYNLTWSWLDTLFAKSKTFHENY